MPWFYVDDGFPDSPKLAEIPEQRLLRAVGLWTLAGAWSRRKLTGGFVPAGQVRRLGGTPGDAQALVKCRLWQEVEGGFRFHDWDEWQETVEELSEQREYNRLRKQAWRRKKRSSSQPCPNGTSLGTTSGQSHDCPGGHGPVLGNSDPDPDPSSFASLKNPPKPPVPGGGSPRVPSDADAPPGFAEPSAFDRSRRVLADHASFAAAFSRAADDLGWDEPALTLGEQTAGAERAARLAAKRGVSRDEAAYAMARAALQEARQAGKPGLIGSLLRTAEPWPPAGSQGPSTRNSRLPKTKGTTEDDFADAPDIEEQMRLRGHLLRGESR